ncbi:BRO family protein [Maridesulfovibrio sp.]|uniref:BRO-N domain-containing protein n=1 Tax=Maridesulfovibrio sp. TaxID=2795000 RepID=UPI0029F4D275|nr:BRO family protein [Maridesulfovibrio sp.]
MVHDLNGSTWFVSKDVVEALGYSNTSDAIGKHCKSQATVAIHDGSQSRNMAIIPEPDLYRLIIKSKLPAAERFEKWVFEEVLPAIRQHGSYELQR